MKRIILFNFVFIALLYSSRYIPGLTNFFKNASALPLLTTTFFMVVADGALEILVIAYTFFNWYVHTYQIANDELVEVYGIFVRRKVITQLKNIVSLSSSQGIIGKRLNYGSISLHLAGTEKPMTLPDIPEPDNVLTLLKQKSNAEIIPPPPLFALPQIPHNEVGKILSQGEHDKLEFKASFRWDLNDKKVNRVLEKAVMKTVAAFMNTEGGVLVIGITDKKTVHGLEYDYLSLPKKNRDGFENHFNQVFGSAIGLIHRPFTTLTFHRHKGKELCIVTVKPNEKPVYVKVDGAEEFFIRTGNATTSLPISDASSYIKSHWS